MTHDRLVSKRAPLDVSPGPRRPALVVVRSPRSASSVELRGEKPEHPTLMGLGSLDPQTASLVLSEHQRPVQRSGVVERRRPVVLREDFDAELAEHYRREAQRILESGYFDQFHEPKLAALP